MSIPAPLGQFHLVGLRGNAMTGHAEQAASASMGLSLSRWTTLAQLGNLQGKLIQCTYLGWPSLEPCLSTLASSIVEDIFARDAGLG